MDAILIDKDIEDFIYEHISHSFIVYTNLYLVGSRVWGFYSNLSDYDIFIETEEVHPFVRTQMNSKIIDLKIYSKEEIFSPYLGRYVLPKYSLLENKFYDVNKNDIVEWILERRRLVPSYFKKKNVDKEWHHNLLNLDTSFT